MKRILVSLLLLAFFSAPVLSLPSNDYIVPLCKQFSKGLFDPNAGPLLSPTLSVVNATTNSGFFHSAYVPAKVDKPYFRVTLNSFGGFVGDDMLTFKPTIPSKEFNMADIPEFITIFPTLNIKDTAGLMNYFFLCLIDRGLKDGTINVPKKSATLLGGEGAIITLEDTTMLNLLKGFLEENEALSNILKLYAPELLNDIENVFTFGELSFPLPTGGNLSTIIAGVPQFEIGSLFGTELLIRLIPKISLGEYIGNFSFWGIGLKHSISQYFYEDKNTDGNALIRENAPLFDLSVQVVYQHTSLDNKVGVTNALLSANANVFCFNVNASKRVLDLLEVYGGIGYERLDITGSFKYYLPVTLQRDLGLMRYDPETDRIITDPPEYPGDNDPQTTKITLDHNQFKLTFGAAVTLGPVIVFVDYSVTKFPVLGAGLQVRF